MSEQDTNYNPFDPKNHSQGGGAWGGKIVTVTRSRAVREALKYADGNPVPQHDKDGKPIPGTQSIQVGWAITGIAEGTDKERTEVYSIGDRIDPTADGEGFAMKDGSPLKIPGSSNAGKLSAALAASGFDMARLYVGGQQKLSALTGARILFGAQVKKDKKGNAITDRKGYTKMTYLPEKYVGQAAGLPQVAGSAPAAGGVVSPLATKADGAVMTALSGAKDTTLTRAELVRTLAQQLSGDPDANAIIGLVVQDAFHQGKPWKFDGMVAKLA